MIQKFKSKLDIHTLEVVVKSSKTMLVKVAGLIVGLLISIFLGRTLGPEGLGIINFANKLGMILLILTMFGFSNVILKFIAIAKSKQDDASIATSLKTSLIFNGLLSMGIAGIAAILLPVILKWWSGNQELYIPLLIAFVMLIPQTFSRVFAAALIGYGKIWQANLVNQTLSTILVGLGLLLYWVFDIGYTPVSVLLLYAVSRVLLAFVVMVLWGHTFKSNSKGEFNLKPMFKMALPMLLITGTGVIASNADVIMLGTLGTLEDVGIYSVAARLALLTSLFLQVTNAAVAPKLASLFSDTKIEEMGIMVQRVTKGLTIIAFSFVMVFVVFGQLMLGLWGAEFQEAYWVLVILAIGQFFNITTGCAGLLLMMCGYEKVHGYISAIAVLLNIILNIVLIKTYGALGAAIATAITVMISNVTKVIFAKRNTGILTIPIFKL
ncbi:flippase [uncultured Eudoraea sp.]|uniref:flippase n=1 Tax=uncultured Eudoraea sp. TaxID=1035614 RepID=UPI00263801E4|nr:flippase [uncultured Eudoraea sp.]